jgi:RNA polymerase sigma-70 factor (ECF subfamily)
MSLALHLTGNLQDAEDIAQDVFMKVFSNLPMFRFQSDFFTWLYRIVVNTAISRKKMERIRRTEPLEAVERRERKHILTGESESGPDAGILRKELREHIRKGLDRLSMVQRAAFVLKFYEDFPIKDISVIMGCSEGTVKSHLFRGVQKMRRFLSAHLV